ncbi:MAG: nickel pincer cofactor biosynthesis protein LarC [Lachnospiraceae bacterium]|nr:nickel pincer cofactor biosynthesis protein LarC [Lachnospiraceae bacterium]
MKKILYLECYSGISGDMTVAALLDLGADKQKVIDAVDSIRPLVSGFDVEIKNVQKSGIAACDFCVSLDAEHENHDHDMEYLHGRGDDYHRDENHHNHDEEGHMHDHHYEDEYTHVHNDEQEHMHDHHHTDAHSRHHHAHTGMAEITNILNQAKLTDGARELALKIFGILAEAESKAHNKPVNEVHFHEVGAVDSIVDIMSAAVCLDSLKTQYDIADIVVSELYEGQGSVRCQHGILPVPVPAVANIIQTHGLAVHFMELQGEFVTPTGAAIAAAIRTSDRLPKKFQVVASGIGAGKRNYEKASLLRAMLVEELSEKSDTIYKLETNIDDCTGEALGYVMDRLFEAGARDVHYTPVFMKKNRPAYQLNVICNEEDIPKLEQIIFEETTTIGIRRVEMERTILEREKATADTTLGKLAVKVCGSRVYPEYESLAAVCREKNIPYLEAYNKAVAELNKKSSACCRVYE